MASTAETTIRPRRSLSDPLRRVPWWAIVAVLLGILFFWQITTDETYSQIFNNLLSGLRITVIVTIIAYSLSVFVGLILAFARLSNNIIIYQVATFYVEIVRGVPILVLLLYVAFVTFDGLVQSVNAVGRFMVEQSFLAGLGNALVGVRLRDISQEARVITALVMAYSPFISEIFRAGIESIGRGQMEAARALGMGYWQAMRFVILPQAIRNVLPPLGNDLIAMLKDSSLVSVLGVRDITGEGRVGAARSFRTFETYNVMAFLYLSMTLALSGVVRWIERRYGSER